VSRVGSWEKAREHKGKSKLRFANPFFCLKSTVSKVLRSCGFCHNSDSSLNFHHVIPVSWYRTTFVNSSCSDDPSPSCQRSLLLFNANCQIWAIAIFGDRGIADLAFCGKMSSELPHWKENVIFTLVNCSHGLISVLGIWIRIRLDPDRFWLESDPWKWKFAVRFSAS
jgi:hypothetical protein